MTAIFRFDFNSPYAYLASTRVDRVLPEPPRWQPIAFAFVLAAQQRVPWSLSSESSREAGKRECEARAERYGLPPLRWPPGWPRDSYSLTPLRAAMVADEQGLLREFSHAAFHRNFAAGLGLASEAAVLEVCEEVGVDADVARAGIGGVGKERLRIATDEAIALAVPGVPTVTLDGRHFWGDDRLEEAAAA